MTTTVRPKLSVCVTTMNEEETIGDCLRSVDFADEWVVVDSHSTDRTRDIAAELGATVIERDWPGYIAQNNYAIEQASHEWVLSLDADERVSPELRASILRALERPGEVVAFTVPRLTFYLGRWIYHCGWYPDRKLRLFRRGRARFQGVFHPRAHADGLTADLEGDLRHYSYRNLGHHLRKIEQFGEAAARANFARGERARMLDLTLRPLGKFVRIYVLKRGFLDGFPGFVVAVTGAFAVFTKYAKLRELQLGLAANWRSGGESPPVQRG